MSETTSSPEPATSPIGTTAAPTATPTVVEAHDVDKRRPGKLNAVAAWVGIVAGSVFIVAVIFFSGFVLGLSAGGGHHHGGGGGRHHDGGGEMHHEGPMFRQGSGGFGGGPGGFGPGGPGGFGPGAQGPGGQGPGGSTQPTR